MKPPITNPDYQWVQAELTKAQADLSGLKARAAAAAAVAAKYHEEAQQPGSEHGHPAEPLAGRQDPRGELSIYMSASVKRRASAMLLTEAAS